MSPAIRRADLPAPTGGYVDRAGTLGWAGPFVDPGHAWPGGVRYHPVQGNPSSRWAEYALLRSCRVHDAAGKLTYASAPAMAVLALRTKEGHIVLVEVPEDALADRAVKLMPWCVKRANQALKAGNPVARCAKWPTKAVLLQRWRKRLGVAT